MPPQELTSRERREAVLGTVLAVGLIGLTLTILACTAAWFGAQLLDLAPTVAMVLTVLAAMVGLGFSISMFRTGYRLEIQRLLDQRHDP